MLCLCIEFVKWMLRISDYIKMLNLNYYFSSRHVRKKNTSVTSSSQYILWFKVILLICALLGHGFL